MRSAGRKTRRAESGGTRSGDARKGAGRGRRGFALLLALVVALGVAVVALQGAAVTQAALTEAIVLQERAAAARTARSAVAAALRALTTDPGEEPTLPNTAGSNASPEAQAPEAGPEIPEFIKAIMPELAEQLEKDQAKDPKPKPNAQEMFASGGLGERVPRDGGFAQLQAEGLPTAPLEFTFGQGRFRITMGDAQSLIGVSDATDEQWQRYFKAKGIEAGVARKLTDQILDWVDQDDFRRAEGAEREQYEEGDITPANGPIRSLDELLYLPAMTREIFDQIKDDLAVAASGKLHAGSAADAVMQAYGVPPDVSRQLVAQRRAGTLTAETVSAVARALPLEVGERLQFKPTRAIKLKVEILAGPGTGQHFDGLAVFETRGVKDIGLRAAR